MRRGLDREGAAVIGFWHRQPGAGVAAAKTTMDRLSALSLTHAAADLTRTTARGCHANCHRRRCPSTRTAVTFRILRIPIASPSAWRAPHHGCLWKKGPNLPLAAENVR